ncbi:MAG: cytochrome c [Acidobacteria bacterium]|nr:cytochrome c [Acidobacteriota bacterium]
MRRYLLTAASIVVLALSVFAVARSRAKSRTLPESGTPGQASGVTDPRYLDRLGARTFEHYCSVCHGKEAKGDGFNAYNLDPRPRDLTLADLQKKRSDQDLFDAIEKGGTSLGYSPGMPPWGKTLSAREIRALVHYIRSIAVTPAPTASVDVTGQAER